MFYITAAVYAFGAIGYVLLGSGELEPWARTKKTTPADENEAEEAVPLKQIK